MPVISKDGPTENDWRIIKEIRKQEKELAWWKDWGSYLYYGNIEPEASEIKEYLEELYDELPSKFRALV